MWTVPTKFSNELVTLARQLDCNWIGTVNVNSYSAYEQNDCHNATMLHASIYGGESIIGWYFVSGFSVIQAIRHSLYYTNGCYADIVPYADGRTINMFGRSRNQKRDYSISNIYSRSLDKYQMHETEIFYYVYQLVDPRDNLPFYIGKGTGRRAKTHLWEIPETRNQYKENKITAIRRAGFEPQIRYIAENIPDEQLAYDIEADLIRYYGRKGYEMNGILTNVCLDSRPPNHKGKSYEEIYGEERAKIERQKRADLQKSRGGYGPKQHTKETKEKIKQSVILAHANRNCSHSEETKRLISIKKKSALRVGRLSKGSKWYKLISPTNTVYELCGNELDAFCKEHDLSESTLRKQIQKGLPPPKFGKTKGWILQDLGKNIL